MYLQLGALPSPCVFASGFMRAPIIGLCLFAPCYVKRENQARCRRTVKWGKYSDAEVR